MQKSTARHKIVHEVSARPHPIRRVVLKVEMRHTLGWRKAPIRNIAGKSRMFIAEQDFPDDRMNSIRTDDDIAVDGGSIVENRPRAIFSLNHVNAAATGVDPVRRQRITQDRQQIRAVEMVVWRTECIFGRVPQILARQDSTVIPAPDFEMRRSNCAGAQGVSETIAMQEAGYIRTHLNAGTYLRLACYLLVDVYVASGPDKGESGRCTTNSTAYHRDP
jgi:hypothetical protein